MSQCPNCGAAMSCGCQKKVLANGKIGCTKCASTVTTTAADEKTNETKKE